MQEHCILRQTNICALTILKVLSGRASSFCTSVEQRMGKVISLSHIFSSSNHNYREACGMLHKPVIEVEAEKCQLHNKIGLCSHSSKEGGP